MRSWFEKTLLLLGALALSILWPNPPSAMYACGDEDFLRVVDKQHSLSPADEPRDLVDLKEINAPALGRVSLRHHAAWAFLRMAQAARAEGHGLVGVSGYRSYAQQRYVFHQNVLKELALAEEAGEPIDEATAIVRANRGSAFAGHSEHQLGTTLDVSAREVGGELTQELERTPSGQWLLAHAHEYGFVVSYPQGKEHLTGYVAEPWHLRWVGERIAQKLYDLSYLDTNNTVTLTKFLMERETEPCVMPFVP